MPERLLTRRPSPVYRKGYATLDYEDAGWRQAKVVKLQLLVNKAPVDAICRVVHVSQADRLARQWATSFKEHVDRQMFGMLYSLRAFRILDMVKDEIGLHLLANRFAQRL